MSARLPVLPQLLEVDAAKRRALGWGLILPALLLVLWGAGSVFAWWPTSIIASPGAVLAALGRLTASGALFVHTGSSLGRLVLGCGIGFTVGVALASLLALVPLAGRVARPTIDFLAPVPILAWIPLFIVFFGIDGARIALIATGTGLILYSATLTAISDTAAEYVDVARLYRKSSLEVLLHISLPAAAWSLFGAVRIALGLSWVLLLASELIASSRGLGWLIWDSRNFSRADEMMAGMVWVALLGFLLDRAVARLQNRATAWRPTFAGLE
jgi:sulfonate transport system permease protein